MADVNNNKWGARVSAAGSASMLISNGATLLQLGLDAIKNELSIQEDIDVDSMVDVGDRRVLIHYHTNPDLLEDQLDSINVHNQSYCVERHWVHPPDDQCLVCARGSANAINEHLIRTYLEAKNIDIVNIVIPRGEEGTANIELVNATDLPYLLCTSHKIKRQPIEFVEGSVIVADPSPSLVIKDIEMVEDIETPLLQNLPSIDINEDMALKVVCTPLQDQGDLLKHSLIMCFKNAPYYLDVDRSRTDPNGQVYITFTDHEGMTQVMQNPPTEILMELIEVSTVPLKEVWPDTPTEPHSSMLVIDNLPTDCPEQIIKIQLEHLFKKQRFTVAKGRIEKGRGYYTFKEEDAVASLINNPPDGSLLSGHPIKYSVFPDPQSLPNPPPAPDTGPCVLVVDGIDANFPQIGEALKYYFKNVAKSHPLSCVVTGQQAIVKFSDSNIARQLVLTPPSANFCGYNLKLSVRSETPPISPPEDRNPFKHQSSDPSPSLKHRASEPFTSMVTSSLPLTTPPPVPKRRQRSQSLIVGQIPAEYNKDHIKLCMESHSKINCKEVKLKNQTALVEMDEPIFIDSLKNSLSNEGEPLTVGTIDPSTSVLITSEYSLDSISVKYFVKRYCHEKFEIDRKSDHNFIVTFKTQQDLKQFEIADHHSMINDKSVSISHYHPLLASFDEMDDHSQPAVYDLVAEDETPPPIPLRSVEDESPPPIPPRWIDPYAVEPVYAEVDKFVYNKQLTDAESKFVMSRLSNMNRELIQVFGEATIVGSDLRIKPLSMANEVLNWRERVSGIVEDHMKDLVSQSIECSEANKGTILEYLLRHQKAHKDFTFQKESNEYVVSGEQSSVTEAVDYINNQESDDAEVIHEIRKPPHLLEYFMKFSKEAIESIQPPVTITQSQSDRGLMIVEGLKESIDQVQVLVNDKLSCVSVEHVLLTKYAHRLIDSSRGRDKVSATLGTFMNTVHCSFERIEGDDTYTHTVYVVSGIAAASLAVVKRKIESLCKEEKIILTPEKSELTSTQKWDQLVIDASHDLFVSVRTLHDTIIITGEETDIRKISHSIHVFMETQNEAEEEMSIETCVYQVIQTKMKGKLQQVLEEGNRNKVRVTQPLVDEDKPNVLIRFNGNPQHIGNMKVQLNHMEAEVLSRSFSIPPQPGIHRLAEKGLLRAKCIDVNQANQVVIRFNIESDRMSPQYNQPSFNAHCVIDATTPTGGIQLAIYTGNYAQLKCDAFVTFVPDNPSLTEPVLVSLTNSGGHEVQKAFEVTLGASAKLRQGSMHSTKRTGRLDCREVVHIVLPRYDLLYGAKSPQFVLSQTLQDLFYQMNHKYNTIIVCPPTSPPLNYPADMYAKCLADSVTSIKPGMYGRDFSLKVFVDDEYEVDEFEMVMKKSDYHIRSRKRVNTLPSFKPKQVKETGTPASLQKVVKIQTGDMFDIQADVYINSTGPEMDFSNGKLAATFKEQCGQSLIDEVKDFLSYETRLRYGKVAVTSAYNIKAKAIYHVALKGVDQPGYDRSFRETIENIFLTAKDHGHRSIAIPCLGVVGLGYKPELSARILFESVISFHHKYPSAINEFIFVVYRLSDAKAFYDEYELKVEQFTKSSLSRASLTTRDFGSLTVEVVLGNLAEERTEVIVNSTSFDMKPNNNAISRAIFRAAGDDMVDTCSSLVDCDVLCTNGNIVPTNASGELRCDKVYHVHIPGKTKREIPPTQSEANLFKHVIRSCLDTAENSRHESLAFPAFCLGIGNYTVEQSASLMFEAIDEFVGSTPKYVGDVRIVILDKQLYDEFHEYYKQVSNTMGQNGLSSLSTNSVGGPLSMGHVNGSATSALPSVPKASCQKTGVRFSVYGIEDRNISSAETELRRFINDSIVTDMVDLGEAIKLFHKDDFKKLLEIAEQNRVEFDIQLEFDRVIVVGEETGVEKVCGKVRQKKNDLQKLAEELQVYQWFVEDRNGHPELYRPDTMAQLEVAYKRNLPSVEILAGQNSKIIVDLNKMEQNDGRKVVRKKKGMELELPHEWDPMPCDSLGNPKVVHFVTLNMFSPEYTQATQGFNKTLGNLKCTIHSVKRVQNPGEYARYLSLKSSWESTLGPGVVKERELFHGTKEDSLLSICSQGFNRIFAADNNAAHYGKGVYFALNAWYSAQDKYSSKTKNSGHKHMLVCTLLVGNYTRGNKSMKIAPPLPNNSQVIYDTLVDKVDSPTIFVAMKDSQAYPKYWITFTKDN